MLSDTSAHSYMHRFFQLWEETEIRRTRMRGEAVLPAPNWSKQSLCFALYEVLYCHGLSTHRLQQLQSGVISYAESLHKSLQ